MQIGLWMFKLVLSESTLRERELCSSHRAAITCGKKKDGSEGKTQRSESEKGTVENCLQAFGLGSLLDRSVIVQLDFTIGAVITMGLLFSLFCTGRSIEDNQCLLCHCMLGV